VPSARLEPTGFSPNVIVGNNSCDLGFNRVPTVGAGVKGAVIAGGGAPSGGVSGCGAGDYHKIWDNNGAIGGGFGNTAGNGNANATDAAFATVSGGVFNSATAYGATVAGGDGNQATWAYAVVSGGNANKADGVGSTIGGGLQNQAGGLRGTVPGGELNAATGDYTFAAGRRAKAVNQGCFAWADSTNADLQCNVNDRFVVRASGGVYLYTNGGQTTGVFVAGGSGTWSSVSDRNAKANVEPVDAQRVLDRVAALPISTWNYRTQESGIRHLGPMAQDFRSAFGLGENDTTIATVDAQGVALAAIQGLNAKLEQSLRERDAELAAQRREIDHVRAALAVLSATQADVAALRAAMTELLRERSSSVLRTRLEP
jgi:hypothetical protein